MYFQYKSKQKVLFTILKETRFVQLSSYNEQTLTAYFYPVINFLVLKLQCTENAKQDTFSRNSSHYQQVKEFSELSRTPLYSPCTKRDSAEAYMKMMEDLDDNLKRNKKLTNRLRSDWSRVSKPMIQNYNLGTVHVFTEQF